MGGLLAFIIIGYLLYKVRGHWVGLAASATFAVILWFLLKLVLVVIFAGVGLGLMWYFMTL